MLDGLTLDQMRVFVMVAETGSFRSAAVRLSRVQSAVSHAIGNLESQLEVTLFDRSGHKPQITPAGASLLADIRALLIKVDAVRGRARGLGQGVELEITVALDPQFPLPVVAHALGELCESYPKVAFRLLSTPLGASYDALLEGRCELAITGLDLINPAIELETLITVRRVAVAAASHPLARAAGATLNTIVLADHVQIVGEDPSALTDKRDYGVMSPTRWRVADNITKMALIMAGIGWGSLPLWMIEEELRDGRLVRLPVAAFGKDGETTLRTYLAHRVDRPLGPASAAFREALLTNLPPGDRTP
ncbi:LysR family transcriptional regulator [Brevundimonas diminuta]|uniref:LysR family transcriptional regulator n=1 Tax=Brevundimonas diminuta TaxID=293 RepID=UPI0032079B7B